MVDRFDGLLNNKDPRFNEDQIRDGLKKLSKEISILGGGLSDDEISERIEAVVDKFRLYKNKQSNP